MTKPIKYVAAPTHVREVTLRGTADSPYWQNRLAPYDLTPADRGGRAPILIIAANMAYMGIRFTEVSFSVEVVPPPGLTHADAAFLIHAFNTSRIFAWSERIFFGTPYYHADCRFSTSAPISIQVIQHEQLLLQVEMRSGLPAAPKSRCEAAANPGKDQYSYRRSPACSRKDATSSTGKCTAKPTFIRLTATWT